MGMFSSEFAAQHKTKKRINQLKKELASLTDTPHMLEMAMQGGKIMQAVRSKSHDTFDTISDQMHSMGKKAKQNPALAVAILAGISAFSAMIIAGMRRYS